MTPVPYLLGAELPDLEIRWEDSSKAVIPFSSGYTFSALVGLEGSPALITKTSGFVGADTAPNLRVSWAVGELDALTPGLIYELLITAERGDNKVRRMVVQLVVEDTVRAQL